jgi:hypothetical protein
MRPATKDQVKAINAILAKKNLMQHKATIVQSCSNGRTTHSTELTVDEARLLLIDLNKNEPESEAKQRMIRKIFAMARDLGWVKKITVIERTGMVHKDDLSAVYGWINKYGYLKKDINQYKYAELPKLVSQFQEGPYRDFIGKA